MRAFSAVTIVRSPLREDFQMYLPIELLLVFHGTHFETWGALTAVVLWEVWLVPPHGSYKHTYTPTSPGDTLYKGVNGEARIARCVACRARLPTGCQSLWSPSRRVSVLEGAGKEEGATRAAPERPAGQEDCNPCT